MAADYATAGLAAVSVAALPVLRVCTKAESVSQSEAAFSAVDCARLASSWARAIYVDESANPFSII